MAIKSGAAYIESLRRSRKRVFLFGEEITNYVDHPVIRPSINALALTYDQANDPQYEQLAVTKSHLTGEAINRFTHISQDTGDLVSKVKLLRLMGQRTACCFQRCAGLDAMNAVYSTTYEIDQDRGTEYHARFKRFMAKVQAEDLVVSAAMTDPKGDRALSPGQQADPDLHLRVTETRADGVVIRGAKAHLTGGLNSHEVLVMPTRNMKEGEEAYAICCSLPADADGLYYIYGRQASDTRRLEEGCGDVGNLNFGGQEALLVFEDVFVPWERVYMHGEREFCVRLVEIFACNHRSSYGGCKSGVGDVLIGAASLAAKANGVEKVHHISDKIVEMNHLNETLYSGGIAASAEGFQLPSGAYSVDWLLANVCKLNVTRFPFDIARMAQDIAGGLMGTLPSEKDFQNPTVGPMVQKYLQGAKGCTPEEKHHILRLIEHLTQGSGAVGYLTESVHGAGSPQAQRIMIHRQADMVAKRRMAAKVAGINPNDSK